MTVVAPTNMSWKISFHQGISSFRDACYEDALQHFTKTIDRGGGQFSVYDSRAAVYEKLGKPKEALRDAKKAIEAAPDRWQGYARAARLFLLIQKFDASITMVNMALDRIKEGDTSRRVELSKLRDEIRMTQKTVAESTLKSPPKGVLGSRHNAQNYFGNLPMELMGEIFGLIVDESPYKLLVLLRVCQHWRNAIWYTPSLWGTLVLTHRNPRQKAAQWVDRSNGYIRELHVTAFAVGHRHWPCEALTRVQWGRLRVCNMETWDIATYLEGISSKHILGRLTNLAVNDYAIVPRILRNSLFVESSMIKSLTMHHANFSWDALTMCCQELNHLEVKDCNTTGELISVLAANSKLETLVIDTQSFPPPLHDIVVELPNLTQLNLAGAALLNVTKCLMLPSLQKLYLCRGSLPLDTVLHSIRSIKLIELSITQSLVSSSRLIDFLRGATSLQSLEISHLSGTTNEVVEALSVPLRTSVDTTHTTESGTTAANLICPSLTHLNVSYSPDVQTGPLVRLVRSRLPRPDPKVAEPIPTFLDKRLQSLQADGCDLIDPEWISWFRNNVQMFSCVYMTKKSASWKR